MVNSLPKFRVMTIKNMRCLRNLFLVMMLLFTIQLFAQVKLPKLISDGMILQRNVDLNIWGWAKKGETVTLIFLDKSYNTVANEQGEWKIKLPKQIAGGPYNMLIKGNANEIKINDVLIGDVWLASGQSNMELPMRRVSPYYEKEIKNPYNAWFFCLPALVWGLGGVVVVVFFIRNHR